MNITEIEALIKEAGTLKTGWKTSEFWVALAPILVVILHVAGVHIGSDATTNMITVAWGAVSAVYVAARTWLKSVHVGKADSLAYIWAQLKKDVETVIPQLEKSAEAPGPGVPSTPAKV